MTTKHHILAATATPLASIFGSGFLVIIPVLAQASGPWMVVAMAVVALFAYAVGAVIRFNIKHAEPILAQQSNRFTVTAEGVSDLAVVAAYVISVTLYIEILAAFLLHGLGMESPRNEAITTTVVVTIIILIAIVKGLATLTKLESLALLTTFALIAAIISGFAIYDLQTNNYTAVASPQLTLWESVTVIAGTLIVVQGFETPRYLGEQFDAATRIASSRWSQIISSVIYLLFVALSLPLLHELQGDFGDSSLIQLVGFTVIPCIGVGVVIAAVLSQFSAAVADTITAEGNVTELSAKRIKASVIYLCIGVLSVTLAWFADTFQLIALASKAFAFYYLMQCVVAVSVAERTAKKILIGLVGLGLLFIVLFAVPAG